MNGDSQSEPTREELIALIRAQAAEIAALKARVAELKRRLGLNSSNSGKPPSSDGLKKPARMRSLREPSDKPSGGQKGHKGETLRQVADPDSVVDHFPPSCTACGAAVTPAMSIGHSVRQVFDLPEQRLLVVGAPSSTQNAYITNNRDNTVSVIVTATNTVVGLPSRISTLAYCF